MGIKTYQEKNANAMEKELAQSEITVRRKVPKTTQNVTFPVVFEIFLLTGMSDWANSFFVGFVFLS